MPRCFRVVAIDASATLRARGVPSAARSAAPLPGRDFLALAEVALAFPHDGRRRGVPRLLPLDVAIILAQAVERAVESREVHVPLGENRRRDHLALDRLFQYSCPVRKSKQAR